MQKQLLQAMLVVALAYEHAHEVVLTLKLGVYPDSAGALKAYRQGRMEANAQLGAYTLCLAVLVGSVIGLARSLRRA